MTIPASNVIGIVPAPAGEWGFLWRESSGYDGNAPNEFCDGLWTVLAFGITTGGIGVALVLAFEGPGYYPVWVRNFDSGSGGWTDSRGVPNHGKGFVMPTEDACRGPEGLGGGDSWWAALAYNDFDHTPDWLDSDTFS